MPRSVTSRNGVLRLARACRLLDRGVGVLRLDHRGSRPGRSARPGPGARPPRRPPAGCVGSRAGAAGGTGARRARAASRRRGRRAAARRRRGGLRLVRDTRAPRLVAGGSAGAAAVRRRRLRERRLHRGRGVAGGPRPCPRARSSSSSWALMPARASRRAMSRVPTTGGASSARLKLNWPSRRRMSCSRATSMRLRMTAAALSGGQLARPRVQGRAVPGERRDHQAVARRRWRLRPPRCGWSGSPSSC